MSFTNLPPLLLATTSPYRLSNFARLGLPFQSSPSGVDEDAYKKKISDPITLAQTLARAKAQALANTFPSHLIIGCDQLAALENSILGKPQTQERAHQQLKFLSGKTHRLITATFCLYQGKSWSDLCQTSLTMRPLTDLEIEQYLELDQPFDCAGSYKIEKNGPSLFLSIDSPDFTSIEGIPLIHLNRFLRQWPKDLCAEP